MSHTRALSITVAASIAALAAGFSTAPLWDEDETRFVAIAQTMLDTGDWLVPTYNGTLAVDKPVLMHWSIASSLAVFGRSEIAARIPSAIATLLAALAVFHAGCRWFSPSTGIVAALAYVGCLLVAIEGHAATPDAILVACLTWITVVTAEGLLPSLVGKDGQTRGDSAESTTVRHSQRSTATCNLVRISLPRAAVVGGLSGLAVLCKGPVGFVGPFAVVFSWAWWVAVDTKLLRRGAATSIGEILSGIVRLAIVTAWRMRPLVTTVAMIAVAGPWYAAVSVRTAGAWPEGFFLTHNLHRFTDPMENHVGGLFYHPITMLAGFYPWSCWLPLVMVVAAWRSWRGTIHGTMRAAVVLLLAWIVIWVGTFSLAATKLPNYVLPAYPAAAILVAALAVEASRRPAWPHPRWMGAGVAALAIGGFVMAAIVLVAVRFGLGGGEPIAALGLVPILTAAVLVGPLRRRHHAAVTAMTVAGLVLTAVAVGPAATRLGRANTLPSLVETALSRGGGHATLAVYHQSSPAIVCYAGDIVSTRNTPEECLSFWEKSPHGHLVVAADRFEEIRDTLPAHVDVIDRVRPLFRDTDVLLIGPRASVQTAAHSEPPPGKTTR